MSQPAHSLASDAVSEIASALTQALTETVVTTMMAQNFHWNVTGMAFGPLHALFQEIYEDHFVAQDDLAERAKIIGGSTGGSLASMVARSKVEDHAGNADDKTMIATLSAAQKTIAASLVGAIDVSEKHGDQLTADLCIARAQQHEKFAWLLDSHLR